MRNRTGVPRWALAGVLTALLMLGGCGGAAESGGTEASDAGAAPSAPAAEPTVTAEQPSEVEGSEPSEAAAADVTVLLSEWIVEPTPTSAAAGELTITADNQGGLEHEMVVVRADDPADLPTDEDGAVDESKVAEGDVIGEIEEFPNGEQRTAGFEMDAGTYVLFCNITDTDADGGVRSHFAEGMATTFAVE